MNYDRLKNERFLRKHSEISGGGCVFLELEKSQGSVCGQTKKKIYKLLCSGDLIDLK